MRRLRHLAALLVSLILLGVPAGGLASSALATLDDPSPDPPVGAADQATK